MKRYIAVAVLALVSTLLPAMPAGAVEDSVGADVTVSTLINFTVQDNGAPGLKFGSLYPGVISSPEVAQGARGAVTLAVGSETNVMVRVSARAENFTYQSHSIPIANAKWNIRDNATAAAPMSNTYVTIGTLTSGTFLDVWHWLSIPAGQAPGTYSTAFYYQAVAA